MNIAGQPPSKGLITENEYAQLCKEWNARKALVVSKLDEARKATWAKSADPSITLITDMYKYTPEQITRQIREKISFRAKTLTIPAQRKNDKARVAQGSTLTDKLMSYSGGRFGNPRTPILVLHSPMMTVGPKAFESIVLDLVRRSVTGAGYSKRADRFDEYAASALAERTDISKDKDSVLEASETMITLYESDFRSDPAWKSLFGTWPDGN
jgi:hypothetical protein